MVHQSRVWQVVGGIGKGGVLVRAGKDLTSAELPTRLSVGALVRELILENDRLEYKLISGSGPDCGWVSTKVQGKSLLVMTDDSFEVEKPKALRERSSSQQNKMHAVPTLSTSEFMHKDQMLYRRTEHPIAPSMVLDTLTSENEKDSAEALDDPLLHSASQDLKSPNQEQQDDAGDKQSLDPATVQSGLRQEANGIRAGALVLMQGLVSAPRFNGQRATVEAWDEEVNRWQVHVALTGEIVKVKPENLILDSKEDKKTTLKDRRRSRSVKQNLEPVNEADSMPQATPIPMSASRAPVFRKGALVSIQNLSSATASVFNGCECTCEDWDAEDGRWIVRVHRDGSFKKLKTENLKLETQLVIQVFGSAGLALNVDVSREWQVLHIKEQIERLTEDIPRSEQRLLLDDAELEDEQLVVDVFRQVDPRSTSLELTLVRRPVFKSVDRDPVLETGLGSAAEGVALSRQPVVFNAFSQLPHQRGRNAGKGGLRGSLGHIRSVTSGSVGVVSSSHASRSNYSRAW